MREKIFICKFSKVLSPQKTGSENRTSQIRLGPQIANQKIGTLESTLNKQICKYENLRICELPNLLADPAHLWWPHFSMKPRRPVNGYWTCNDESLLNFQGLQYALNG